MARIPVCMNPNCNAHGTVKVMIPNRGNRYGYMCDWHASHLDGYFDENNNRHGKRKVNGYTFSIELETSFSTTKARGELMNLDYIATSDSTVDVEYKSPIYEGLNAVSKHCVSIETLMTNGELGIDRSCGTHFHIGHVDYINDETMGYIRRFYHSLFLPLSDAMRNNPDKTTALYGRDLSGNWARPIYNYTSATEHTNFINLEHAYTIEFRTCKFINANQYMKCVKFNRDIVNAVIENFIKHFNDTDFDQRRYPTIREYRKHKAQITAGKIMKLWEKYTNE